MWCIIALIVSLTCLTTVEAWTWTTKASTDCYVKLGDSLYSPTVRKWTHKKYARGCGAVVKRIPSRSVCNIHRLETSERVQACDLWCRLTSNCNPTSSDYVDVRVTKMGHAWCGGGVVKGPTFTVRCRTLHNVYASRRVVQGVNPKDLKALLKELDSGCRAGNAMC